MTNPNRPRTLVIYASQRRKDDQSSPGVYAVGHRLTAVLEDHRRRGIQLTRSILENRFLKLCERYGLPRPRANFYVEGHEVDACWPAHHLAVELDGWQRHKDRVAFQRDRTKGNAIQQAGWRLLRYTHDDVVRRPAETAAAISALLADA